MKFLLVHHGEEESFQKCLHASEFVTGPHRTQQGRLRFRPCCARIRRFVGDGRTEKHPVHAIKSTCVGGVNGLDDKDDFKTKIL